MNPLRKPSPALHPPGLRPAAARRHQGERSVEEYGWVVEEKPLFIDIENGDRYTLLRTESDGGGAAVAYTAEEGVLAEAELPDTLALAAGFLVSEGIIEGFSDLRSMAICADAPTHLRVVLARPERTRRGGRLVASACGFCGEGEAEESFRLPVVPDRLRLTHDRLSEIMRRMEKRQPLFQATGGTHCAGLFDAEGQLLALAEDIGRHNALDKVIGERLLRGGEVAGCGALLSGRVSVELVAKAARCGIELISAISAPTSLAIETAERCGITLCAFVRQGRMTVYSHPQRLQ